MVNKNNYILNNIHSLPLINISRERTNFDAWGYRRFCSRYYRGRAYSLTNAWKLDFLPWNWCRNHVLSTKVVRKRFCTRTDRTFFFQKMFIIKGGRQIGSQWQNANKFHIYENFSWRLYYRRLSQNDLNYFKNRPGTCGFADRKFFSISNPERFFSSLKKTIVLYLVKKFEN